MATSLIPSVISFPRSPTWYFLPQENSGTSLQKRDRKNQPAGVAMPKDGTENEPQYPRPTGVEHWEEQRREWTRGFSRRVKDENDNVTYFFNLGGWF